MLIYITSLAAENHVCCPSISPFSPDLPRPVQRWPSEHRIMVYVGLMNHQQTLVINNIWSGSPNHYTIFFPCNYRCFPQFLWLVLYPFTIFYPHVCWLDHHLSASHFEMPQGRPQGFFSWEIPLGLELCMLIDWFGGSPSYEALDYWTIFWTLDPVVILIILY